MITAKTNAATRKSIISEILGGTHVEKNSKNSSIPPTQQPLEDKIIQHTKSLREPSGRKTGGQLGHEGHTLTKKVNPDEVIEHKVKVCPHCGSVIPEDCGQVCAKSVQEIDITGPMMLPHVAQHNEYSAVCPHCQKTAKEDNPTGNSKNTIYGPKPCPLHLQKVIRPLPSGETFL